MYANTDRVIRLPTTVKPVNYKLDFIPDFSKFIYHGFEQVELEVLEPANHILFHAKGLDVQAVEFEGIPGVAQVVNDQELARFDFLSSVPIGKGILKFNFKGKFSDDMLGLYRSTYKDENGNEMNVLATQFESVFARRAFPCMDEPDRKATFDISITALDNKTTLSNMPEISREIVSTPQGFVEPPDGHNYVKVSFDRTPYMSTYLVAMVVGDFEYISSQVPTEKTANQINGEKENQIEVRVYTPLGKRNFGQHALSVATKTLPFYAELFGAAYPLPKLDLIAIPDFGCGAMENWGLVTYRETSLLIDPLNSSLLSKQQVALTVSHELAHMWFGNLVTMSWWTDLWLNEGFATWTEYLAVDYCFPEYDIWTSFVADEYIRALRLDELRSSHPIEVEIVAAHDVEEIFDAVSYQKGSCVIRMLQNHMGFEKFQTGLRSYIQQYKYSNASTQDLWTALETHSVPNINELMSLWTKQTGYPVVCVRLIKSPDEDVYSIGVKQKRFLADGSSVNDKPGSHWPLPVNVCAADDSSNILFREVAIPSTNHVNSEGFSEEIIYPLPSSASPHIRLNPNANDFYRVYYDQSLMEGIMLCLKKGSVPERDRISLLDDQFALARAGIQGSVTVMEFCRALAGESRHTVWSVLAGGLAQIRHLLEEASYPESDDIIFPLPSKALLGLDQIYIELALPVYEKIGFEPTSADTCNELLLRPIIIAVLGRVGYKDVVEKAQAAFERHHKAVISSTDDQSQLIPSDLRRAIYAICMRSGGDKVFNMLLELHERAQMNDERVKILGSLGMTRDPELLKRVIELAYADFVRKQDRYHVLLGVTGTPGGRRTLWNFVKSRIDNLVEDLATTDLLSSVLKGAAKGFASMKRHDEIRDFLTAHKLPCQRAVQQILESVRNNSDRLGRDEMALKEYLEKFAP
nr:puromycin sensitive aminopeptidase [Hymenolepis microstoma]